MADTTENTAVVKRFTEQAFNRLDEGILGELLRSDFVRHDSSLPGKRGDRRAVRDMINSFKAGLPDVKQELEVLAQGGDTVVVRWIVRGSHLGPFFGARSTGNTIEYSGISVYRLAAGLIVEEWTEWDEYGLLQQLGALPRAQRAA